MPALPCYAQTCFLVGNVARYHGLAHDEVCLQAQYLRLNADFENFRRRAATEKDANTTRVKAKTIEARLCSCAICKPIGGRCSLEPLLSICETTALYHDA